MIPVKISGRRLYEPALNDFGHGRGFVMKDEVELKKPGPMETNERPERVVWPETLSGEISFC